MKLIAILLAACALAAASSEDHPHGKKIQLCGRDLADAIDRVCKFGDLDYFNSEHVQNLPHAHQEVLNWKGHSMKRDTSYNLIEMCCMKPCLAKDFVSYCP